MDKNPNLDPFSNVTHLLTNADITIANFEGFVADADVLTPTRKGLRMGVSDRAIHMIKDSGIDALCLANNHLMDDGVNGLNRSLSALAAEGIHTFGAGKNIEHAKTHAMIRKNGLKIAFIGACDYSPHYATKKLAGVLPAERKILLNCIKAAKESADLIIVNLHADLEFTDYPAPWRIKLSRQLINAGANMVIQHHPHVIQGVEIYNEGLIAYSLGNFVFSVKDNAYQGVHAGTDVGLLIYADVELDQTAKLAWSAILLQLDNDGIPSPLMGDNSRPYYDRLSQLSIDLKRPETVITSWKQRSKAEILSGLGNAYWFLRKGKPASAWKEIKRITLQPEVRRLLSALLR